ncbi:MAG: Ca2+-dependent phosphoinositide-specific phospholipase C [Ilumatobacter sp.]|uniref:Ca2+-dependent phosphoinositide-specific phospholipase C n=1 Tax=Ilumatobacter sp. TaxID=1967498 RepID=UPI00261AFB6F|nr:Ca2+-dependent phosphoinositide-specific phospholipase C [Ilumatobacter sp.]MDJ0767744.1 Ca2+-dependent phosphoinositide-specific phospholipase C [Ilumatobacter sp.]
MAYDDLRYDDVRQKSIHNTFQRTEGIYDQIVYWRVRSLEADIHTSHIFDDPETGGDFDEWFVYHNTFDMGSSVHTLHDFLRVCVGAHRALPDHEAITLFLDIKDGFPSRITSAHSRARFDALLDHHLGEHLYTPADLMKRDPDAGSLREVVQGVGWPTLGELRGKFIVILTGSEHQLSNYVSSREEPTDRLAFLSGYAESKRDIGRDDGLVVYNMSREYVHLAAEVGRQGFLSRAYYIDDRDAWEEAEAARCHHIATDMVNSRVDPWSSTTGPSGFPFRALDGPTPREVEPGVVGAIWARSGDIWEREDSCYFQHRACGPRDVDESYVFAVSGPNSHTEDWTKGGIMARQSTDPDSPYFGVFRPGEGDGLRVQFRAESRRSTTVLERRIGRTWLFGSCFAQDSLVYLRLDVSRGGRRCVGSGSIDGVEWVRLGSFDFEQPLMLHGLAVSSHGQRRGAKYLFVVPGGEPPPPFDRERAIGPRGDRAEGWADWTGTRRWRVDRFSR